MSSYRSTDQRIHCPLNVLKRNQMLFLPSDKNVGTLTKYAACQTLSLLDNLLTNQLLMLCQFTIWSTCRLNDQRTDQVVDCTYLKITFRVIIKSHFSVKTRDVHKSSSLHTGWPQTGLSPNRLGASDQPGTGSASAGGTRQGCQACEPSVRRWGHDDHSRAVSAAACRAESACHCFSPATAHNSPSSANSGQCVRPFQHSCHFKGGLCGQSYERYWQKYMGQWNHNSHLFYKVELAN